MLLEVKPSPRFPFTSASWSKVTRELSSPVPIATYLAALLCLPHQDRLGWEAKRDLFLFRLFLPSIEVTAMENINTSPKVIVHE